MAPGGDASGDCLWCGGHSANCRLDGVCRGCVLVESKLRLDEPYNPAADHPGALSPPPLVELERQLARLPRLERAVGRLRLDPGDRAVPDEISEGAADVVVHGRGAPLLLALSGGGA